ncbi:MAG: hypothetical protein L0Y54_10540, partial [Sporichthyaceae bacterium]|nr:hypothetical protein [Sporichthyaceae bacterium]
MLLTPVIAVQSSAAPQPDRLDLTPTFTNAAAFDVSKPLRELARTATPGAARVDRVNFDRSPAVADRGSAGFTGDGAVQSAPGAGVQAIPGTIANFEGLSNQDNFDTFGFRVNPPDPNG